MDSEDHTESGLAFCGSEQLSDYQRLIEPLSDDQQPSSEDEHPSDSKSDSDESESESTDEQQSTGTSEGTPKRTDKDESTRGLANPNGKQTLYFKSVLPEIQSTSLTRGWEDLSQVSGKKSTGWSQKAHLTQTGTCDKTTKATTGYDTHLQHPNPDTEQKKKSGKRISKSLKCQKYSSQIRQKALIGRNPVDNSTDKLTGDDREKDSGVTSIHYNTEKSVEQSSFPFAIHPNSKKNENGLNRPKSSTDNPADRTKTGVEKVSKPHSAHPLKRSVKDTTHLEITKAKIKSFFHTGVHQGSPPKRYPFQSSLLFEDPKERQRPNPSAETAGKNLQQKGFQGDRGQQERGHKQDKTYSDHPPGLSHGQHLPLETTSSRGIISSAGPRRARQPETQSQLWRKVAGLHSTASVGTTPLPRIRSNVYDGFERSNKNTSSPISPSASQSQNDPDHLYSKRNKQLSSKTEHAVSISSFKPCLDDNENARKRSSVKPLSQELVTQFNEDVQDSINNPKETISSRKSKTFESLKTRRKSKQADGLRRGLKPVATDSAGKRGSLKEVDSQWKRRTKDSDSEEKCGSKADVSQQKRSCDVADGQEEDEIEEADSGGKDDSRPITVTESSGTSGDDNGPTDKQSTENTSTTDQNLEETISEQDVFSGREDSYEQVTSECKKSRRPTRKLMSKGSISEEIDTKFHQKTHRPSRKMSRNVSADSESEADKERGERRESTGRSKKVVKQPEQVVGKPRQSSDQQINTDANRDSPPSHQAAETTNDEKTTTSISSPGRKTTPDILFHGYVMKHRKSTRRTLEFSRERLTSVIGKSKDNKKKGIKFRKRISRFESSSTSSDQGSEGRPSTDGNEELSPADVIKKLLEAPSSIDDTMLKLEMKASHQSSLSDLPQIPSKKLSTVKSVPYRSLFELVSGSQEESGSLADSHSKAVKSQGELDKEEQEKWEQMHANIKSSVVQRQSSSFVLPGQSSDELILHPSASAKKTDSWPEMGLIKRRQSMKAPLVPLDSIEMTPSQCFLWSRKSLKSQNLFPGAEWLETGHVAGRSSLNTPEPQKEVAMGTMARKWRRFGTSHRQKTERLKSDSGEDLEKDVQNYQILHLVQTLVKARRHNENRARWFRAMELVCNACYIAKSMAQRSYALTVELPTFMDIGDSALGIFKDSGGAYIDTRVYKLGGLDNFNMNWEEKNIMLSNPEDRTEKQLSIVMYSLQFIDSFCDLPLHTQREVARLSIYEQIDKNRVIIRQGHKPTNIYYILSGQAVVTEIVEGPNGPMRQTHAILTKGMMFGEASVIVTTRRTSTVTSRTDMQLLVIDRDDYINIFMPERLLDGIPEYIKYLSERSWMKQWPVEKLMNSHKCFMRYYRHRYVIVPDSLSSDYLYVIRTGKCQVLMLINGLKTSWKDLEHLILKEFIKSNKNLVSDAEKTAQKPLHKPVSSSEVREYAAPYEFLRRNTAMSFSRPWGTESDSKIEIQILADLKRLTPSADLSPRKKLAVPSTERPKKKSIEAKKTTPYWKKKPFEMTKVPSLMKKESVEIKRTPSEEIAAKLLHETVSTLMECLPNSSTPPRRSLLKTELEGRERSRTKSVNFELNLSENCRMSDSNSDNTSNNNSQNNSGRKFSNSGGDSGDNGNSSSNIEEDYSISFDSERTASPDVSTLGYAKRPAYPATSSARSPQPPAWRKRPTKTGPTKSSWTLRREYQIPDKCRPSRPSGHTSTCVEEDVDRPVYVELEALREGDVFGFDQLEMPYAVKPKSHKVSLVSCGAEVIAIEKRFFVSHANTALQQTVHLMAKGYVSPEEVQYRCRLQMAWELYQKKMKEDLERKISSNCFGHGLHFQPGPLVDPLASVGIITDTR